jgi:general stress protein YciG
MPTYNPDAIKQSSHGEQLDSNSDESNTKAQEGPIDGAPASTGAKAAAAPTRGVSKRGFASMDQETQRLIASKGGHSQGRQNNPGNFANDRERARIAGRKGGEAHGHNSNR